MGNAESEIRNPKSGIRSPQEGKVFAIKRFALHDGPGIRTTVFLKGCPLHCLWCHNPEGLSYERQLAFYPHLCAACDKCYQACPSGALRKRSSPIQDYEKEKCVVCGKCAEACPANAIELIGQDLSPDQVIAEVERDRKFYDISGGGMTVSGGEPLAQPEFTAELLSRGKGTGIHTILDTCGLAPFEILGKCLEFTDHVYFDLKVVDDEKHRRLTGVSNRLILDNLMKLGDSGKPLTIRIPLVKGLNDTPEDTSSFIDLIASLPAVTNLHRIEIIPYHRIGEGKYESIGLDYELKSQEIHSQDDLCSIVSLFEAGGLTVYCSKLLPPSLGG
ncbi:glycyl-radical enzyme activating protein [bacterium]|nr:glycyl-radical enzyme activating protein [bacterium]